MPSNPKPLIHQNLILQNTNYCRNTFEFSPLLAFPLTIFSLLFSTPIYAQTPYTTTATTATTLKQIGLYKIPTEELKDNGFDINHLQLTLPKKGGIPENITLASPLDYLSIIPYTIQTIDNKEYLIFANTGIDQAKQDYKKNWLVQKHP